MDGDDDDFVFYGTPIEREEDLTSRKKKAVAEASGQLRTLPAWKQEVVDEEGRRRFHGAFTGGFSAGYYNTVGSKEGWTPQTFTSSRKNRAELKQQSILNFLDDDEKSELEGRSVAASSQFDTFGFTAAEVARKQAEKEQQQRPSAIPGPIPDELLLPATESIGVKLLLKMGWRRDHSIKELRADLQHDTRREARKALLAFSSNERTNFFQSEPAGDNIDSQEKQFDHEVRSSQSTPIYVRNPKQDLHGLGYDPYKHAPEFREKKRARLASEKEHKARKPLSLGESLFGLKSGNAAPGFGIGALEEYDVEDEDVYTTAYEFEDHYVKEVEEPSRSSVDYVQRLGWKEQDILPGFKAASISDYRSERFDPPVIPRDFEPHHNFPGPLEANKHAIPSPPEAPAPEDSNLKILIDGVASLVARCGKLFEDLSREKNRANPSFSFLDGGNGHAYYARKLWEEQQKHGDQKKLALPTKNASSVEKLSAESRGKMLGEKPLERSSRDTGTSFPAVNINLQFNLSDTFTKSSSSTNVPEAAKPFKDDPFKQQRFEQFLREKYHGGLRTSESGGSSNLSEAARARERLDFEAAAEAMDKGKWTKEGQVIAQQSMEVPATGGLQFTSGGTEKSKGVEADNIQTKSDYPKREEFQWRPAPVLCKRFDLIDPYMGKPPPPPRAKSKLDSLIFTPDFVKFTKMEETFPASKDSMATLDVQETSSVADNTKLEIEVENVERPVDLYKAIFSDDDDDDDAGIKSPHANKPEDTEKKTEVAHTALSRLMAGDFLESLGMELGFEVPPEQLYPPTKVTASALQKGTTVSAGNAPVEKNLVSKPNASDQVSSSQILGHGIIGIEREPRKNGQTINTDYRDRYLGPSPLDAKSPSDAKSDSDKVVEKERGLKLPSISKHDRSSSSSSENERSRKRSRRHRRKKSDSESDSSSDDDDHHHSKSRREKDSSRKKKKSSKKHSKRHRHGDRDSPSRSSRHSKKDERRKRND